MRCATCPQVAADLDALDTLDPELAAAVLATLDDLAHGRQRGKVLGDRNITGDLTGLALNDVTTGQPRAGADSHSQLPHW